MGDLQESESYDGHKCYAKTWGVGSWGLKLWLAQTLAKNFWEQKNCQLSVRSDQTRSADRLRWTGHIWGFLLLSAGQMERERSEEKFGIPRNRCHDSVGCVGWVSAGVFLFIQHSSEDILALQADLLIRFYVILGVYWKIYKLITADLCPPALYMPKQLIAHISEATGPVSYYICLTCGVMTWEHDRGNDTPLVRGVENMDVHKRKSCVSGFYMLKELGNPDPTDTSLSKCPDPPTSKCKLSVHATTPISKMCCQVLPVSSAGIVPRNSSADLLRVSLLLIKLFYLELHNSRDQNVWTASLLPT